MDYYSDPLGLWIKIIRQAIPLHLYELIYVYLLPPCGDMVSLRGFRLPWKQFLSLRLHRELVKFPNGRGIFDFVPGWLTFVFIPRFMRRIISIINLKWISVMAGFRFELISCLNLKKNLYDSIHILFDTWFISRIYLRDNIVNLIHKSRSLLNFHNNP